MTLYYDDDEPDMTLAAERFIFFERPATAEYPDPRVLVEFADVFADAELQCTDVSRYGLSGEVHDELTRFGLDEVSSNTYVARVDAGFAHAACVAALDVSPYFVRVPAPPLQPGCF